MTSSELLPDAVLPPHEWGPTTAEAPSGQVSDLARLGIRYLAGQSVEDVVLRTQHPREVLAQLAQQADPRLRASLIALFLLHPTWAPLVLEPRRGASTPSDPADSAAPADLSATMATFLLAARYLQEQWYYQLTLALRRPPQLPTALLAPLWRERQLPAPWIGQGEPGLRALERDEQRRTGQPWAYAADWHNQLSQLLEQERTSKPLVSAAPAALAPANDPPRDPDLPGTTARPPFLPPPPPHLPAHAHMPSADAGAVDDPDDPDDPIAWRPSITRTTIAQFLHTLGQTLDHPAHLTLGTDTSLVWWDLRPASDVLDLALGWGATAPAATIPTDELARRLADVRTQAHWEVGWPGQQIPLPQGWQRRSPVVGRFGLLTVAACDPVSIALAALAQGTTRDFVTVLALVAGRRCTLAQVIAGCEALHEALRAASAHAHLVTRPDEAVLEANVAAVRRWVDHTTRQTTTTLTTPTKDPRQRRHTLRGAP